MFILTAPIIKSTDNRLVLILIIHFCDSFDNQNEMALITIQKGTSVIAKIKALFDILIQHLNLMNLHLNMVRRT